MGEYPSTTGKYPLAAAEAELEAIYRLDAIRPSLAAILEGRWLLDPEIISGIARVVESSAGWARRAQELATPA